MIVVKICNDFGYIHDVIVNDPEMFERSSDDYTEKIYWDSMPPGCSWLECVKDGDRIGLAYARFDSNSAINVHIHIPKIHRGRGTKAVGQEVLRWIVRNSPASIHKINTKIPIIYQDVVRYAHSLGFRDEGIDRSSVMKNGELIDRICLGICFKEIR